MDEKAEKVKVLDRVKGFGKKGWDKVKSLPKKILIIIAAVVLVLVIAAVALALSLNHREYAVLVSGVSDNEAATVMKWLDEQSVTGYRLESEGTVLVPKCQEDTLKVRLLTEEVTKTGYFYNTYFDHINSLSTNAERNQVALMDLQDRLAATIRTFAGVRDAVVFINPGEDRSYILDTNNLVEATASVKVTMSGEQELTPEIASAIRTLVSRAVQGLVIDSVEVLDSLGNSYPDFGTGGNDASDLKLRLETEWENRIRREIMHLLTPLFGEDNVRVGVNCDVEVGNVTENRTDYWLPPFAEDGSTGGRGIIGTEQGDVYIGRPGDNPVGGLVGSETNSDLPEYVEPEMNAQDGDNLFNAGGQKDYLTSHSDKQIYNDAGRITDCSVGVTINSRVLSGPLDVEEIRTLVARAAGITGELDEDTGEELLGQKISVVAMEFYDPTVVGPGGVPIEDDDNFMWVWIAAGAGLLLFIILLVVILLLRRKRRKKQEAELAAQENDVEALLAAAGLGEGEAQTGADVMTLQTEKSMELRKEIRQFASDNPEVAAQIIKSWLKGGDDNA